MKTTELSLLAIAGGHLGFFSLPMLFVGAWFWGGIALGVAILIWLRFVKLILEDWQRGVDEMTAGTVWHPRSAGGARPTGPVVEVEQDFDEEVEEVLRKMAAADGKGGVQ